MPESPANLLRRAVEAIRRDAQLLLDEMDAEPYYWDPNADDITAYRQGVDSGLGGPAGTYAAAWHPGVAFAVADWLAAVADNAALHELTRAAFGPDRAREWDAAVRTARAYLNEETS
ncbi:hypothetical protein Caci_2981 [Catenulispora acidiphila DSM 44928]|uniref:Uncharacterized protein n=1 Tax=Catenulispora acidiphila (strain DSM 44928 / JCM 14897 / NBRC 102108 / NRRL B-24433 / ID139908) TaxID=479433 RepID=C7Q2Z8_CATAD|nr:hypothetical protein [Catenulispora acidiphila]ACU71890.1 hypothetical protein Caci_2981 [Catenulispora acidiphila DSM 44928]